MKVERTLVMNGEHRLVAEIIRPDKSCPLRQIFWAHGWDGDMQGNRDRAEALTELGYTSINYDLRGHGESSGNRELVTVSQHAMDQVAVYDALVKLRHECHAVGASYGGFLAPLLSQERPVRSLLLRSPTLFADEDLLRPVVQVRSAPNRDAFLHMFHYRDESIALRAATQFTGPACVIEAENDALIGSSIIDSYLDAFPKGEQRFIPGADHSLSEPGWKEAYMALLMEWFEARLSD